MTIDATVEEGALTGNRLEEAVAVSVRAFGDDPFFRLLFPQDDRRDRSVGILHRVTLKHLSAIGTTRTAYVDGRIAGVALWLPPGRWPFPIWVQVRQLFGNVSAFRGDFGAIGRVRPLLKEVVQAHPKVPQHYYLQLLMTDPPFQRRGIGTMLLRPTLEQCDREGLPAWLETQKEENLPYYARFGFEVVSRHGLEGSDVAIWSLSRKAVDHG